MPNVHVDPIAILTLIGLVVGFTTGGHIEGSGIQLGAVVTFGEKTTVGINPIFHMTTTSLPTSTDGLTLGCTTISVLPEFGMYSEDNGRIYTRHEWWAYTTHYEYGHVFGWAHFGIDYAAISQAEFRKYDPATSYIPRELATVHRPLNMWELQPSHFTVSFTLEER